MWPKIDHFIHFSVLRGIVYVHWATIISSTFSSSQTESVHWLNNISNSPPPTITIVLPAVSRDLIWMDSQGWSLGDWLTPLSISSRFIYVVNQNVFAFKGRIILHCMNRPRVAYPFILWWTLGCFHLWVSVNTMVHTSVHMSGRVPGLRSCGHTPRSGTAELRSF